MPPCHKHPLFDSSIPLWYFCRVDCRIESSWLFILSLLNSSIRLDAWVCKASKTQDMKNCVTRIRYAKYQTIIPLRICLKRNELDPWCLMYPCYPYSFRCSSWRRQLYPLLEAMHWNSHLQRNNIIWVKGWYKKGVRSLNWGNSLITSFGRLFIDSEGIKTLSSIAVSSFWRQSLCSNVSLEASWLQACSLPALFSIWFRVVPCLCGKVGALHDIMSGLHSNQFKQKSRCRVEGSWGWFYSLRFCCKMLHTQCAFTGLSATSRKLRARHNYRLPTAFRGNSPCWRLQRIESNRHCPV